MLAQTSTEFLKHLRKSVFAHRCVLRCTLICWCGLHGLVCLWVCLASGEELAWLCDGPLFLPTLTAQGTSPLTGLARW